MVNEIILRLKPEKLSRPPWFAGSSAGSLEIHPPLTDSRLAYCTPYPGLSLFCPISLHLDKRTKQYLEKL